jgi:hypothetical protein
MGTEELGAVDCDNEERYQRSGRVFLSLQEQFSIMQGSDAEFREVLMVEMNGVLDSVRKEGAYGELRNRQVFILNSQSN